MNSVLPPTRQCVYCSAPASDVRYHSRYQTQDGTRIVFRCRNCRKTFCDHFGTAFYDLKTPSEQVTRAVQQVAEGLSFEAVARIEQLHPTTIQRWLERASERAAIADSQILREISAEVVEVDELYSFAQDKQQPPSTGESETGKHWTHLAMVRESRLLLALAVGPRTEETATELIRESARRLAPGSLPLWCSDGWESYVAALVSVFHLVLYQIRKRGRGRPRLPQVIAHPRLRYAQVIKQKIGERIACVKKRIIYGASELIPLWQVATSLLERLNGTVRGHVAPLHRRTRAACQAAANIEVTLNSLQELLQFVFAAFKFKRSDSSASCRIDRAAAELKRVIKLWRNRNFKDQLGSTFRVSR